MEKLQRVAHFLFGGLSNGYDWLKHGENEVERCVFDFLTETREDCKIDDLARVKQNAEQLQKYVADFISKIEEAQTFINEDEE